MSRLQKWRPFVTALAATTALVALVAPLSAAARTAPSATGPSAASIVARYQVPDFPETPIGPKRDPKKPDIVVIDAGGTLTSRARDRISYLHYQGSVEGGVQTILEDMYPELAQVANQIGRASCRERV